MRFSRQVDSYSQELRGTRGLDALCTALFLRIYTVFPEFQDSRLAMFTLHVEREADSSSTTCGRYEQLGMSVHTDILTTIEFEWKSVVWAKIFESHEHHDLLLEIYSGALM